MLLTSKCGRYVIICGLSSCIENHQKMMNDSYLDMWYVITMSLDTSFHLSASIWICGMSSRCHQPPAPDASFTFL